MWHEQDWWITRKPKLIEMMRVVAIEMEARLRSPRWPANDWVMTVMENMARRLKIEGPAICHNFFDSSHISLIVLLDTPLDRCTCWCRCVCASSPENRRGFSSSPTPMTSTSPAQQRQWMRIGFLDEGCMWGHLVFGWWMLSYLFFFNAFFPSQPSKIGFFHKKLLMGQHHFII